jgi:hypothetical protein
MKNSAPWGSSRYCERQIRKANKIFLGYQLCQLGTNDPEDFIDFSGRECYGSSKFGKVWNVSVVTYFKVWAQHLLRGTEGHHDKPSSG